MEDDGVLLIIELWLEDVRNVYYLKLDKDGNVAGTTGIPGLKVYDAVINIAPNPSTDYFQVENLSAWKKNTTIRVVNALGQMVATRQIEYDTEQPKFNTLDWHSGVYYVQVFNDTGLVQTKKVVVR